MKVAIIIALLAIGSFCGPTQAQVPQAPLQDFVASAVISVNTCLSFDGLVTGGKYIKIDPRICLNNFPASKFSDSTDQIYIIRPAKPAGSIAEKFAFLKRAGFEPASLRQLLGIGISGWLVEIGAQEEIFGIIAGEVSCQDEAPGFVPVLHICSDGDNNISRCLIYQELLVVEITSNPDSRHYALAVIRR